MLMTLMVSIVYKCFHGPCSLQPLPPRPNVLFTSLKGEEVGLYKRSNTLPHICLEWKSFSSIGLHIALFNIVDYDDLCAGLQAPWGPSPLPLQKDRQRAPGPRMEGEQIVFTWRMHAHIHTLSYIYVCIHIYIYVYTHTHKKCNSYTQALTYT